MLNIKQRVFPYKFFYTLFLTVVFFGLSSSTVFAATKSFGFVPAEHLAVATLIILLIAAVLFFTEVIPLPITAMSVPVMLSLVGAINPKTAFINFGDQWVIIFMGMFIIGHATFITGLADKIGRFTLKVSKGSEKRLLIFSMITIGGLSSILSNTGTIVVAIPMILAMCKTADINPRRILMPVAFACSVGGTMTLVGTPPNGLINSMLSSTPGLEPFGFFEFALIGLPLFVVTILMYTIFGSKLQPKDKPMPKDSIVPIIEEETVFRTNKMPILIIIFVGVIVCMATAVIPLVTAAMAGACLVVITRCITMKEAFEGIDWVTIFLFAGMLSMSTAMNNSGAATMIADLVVANITEPRILLAAVCIITAVITNFMSNTATAALMAPLAFPIALGVGISPLPIAMGIAMSASSCFLTPIATPPNTIVLGYGNYSFIDYVRYGWVLQVTLIAVCIILIPMIWPFYP